MSTKATIAYAAWGDRLRVRSTLHAYVDMTRDDGAVTVEIWLSTGDGPKNGRISMAVSLPHKEALRFAREMGAWAARHRPRGER